MDELPPYPPVEPTTFDLIVIGTGLPESVLAAAASSAGKSVLHLDPNPYYGSHFTSLNPNDLSTFLNSHFSPNPNPDEPSLLNLTTRSPYFDVEITHLAPELLDETKLRKFNLDVSGPRVLFCADKAIDTILKSGINQYLEFKSIDGSLIYDGSGKLVDVPDSRSAIFKDKSLSLREKTLLNGFLKTVKEHFDVNDPEAVRISEEELESPFVEFLNKKRLPLKIKSIIMYAIAMVDYDQDNIEICKDVVKTRYGIDRLALYNSSIGRFPNAAGAMIYPMYGQGELTQAFCRRAAVKGCLHVLRMPVTALHVDTDNGQYRGVRIGSGQDLFSQKLVLDPAFAVSSSLNDTLAESLQVSNPSDVKVRVARGLCITSASLKADAKNVLLIFPPRSLFPEQATSIRLLQIGSNLAICPHGMFVLYLSTLCDDASEGKKLLNSAIEALVAFHASQIIPSEENVDGEDRKPFILWKALYIQGQLDLVGSTPMPDGNLDYNNLLDATEKLFQKMYPDVPFFPEAALPENTEDEVEADTET